MQQGSNDDTGNSLELKVHRVSDRCGISLCFLQKFRITHDALVNLLRHSREAGLVGTLKQTPSLKNLMPLIYKLLVILLQSTHMQTGIL